MVETLPAPAKATVLLQQHIGAPAKPVVSKGDEVARGQVIAEAGGFVSIPYHSPVSGRVVALEKALHPLGMTVDAVVIENDGADRPAPGVGEPAADGATLEPKEIVGRIQAAGICGMGGAGFPTHVKLSPPEDKPIDTLILNGAECEPALSADHRVMLEAPEEILKGLRYLQRALERSGRLPRAIVALEDDTPDAAEALREASESLGIDCEVVMRPVWYPQGAEKQLIYAVTGREVPPQSERGLPMDVGCVVQNVGTARAVSRAIDRGMPLVERVLTVAGDAVGSPANLRARLGTPLAEVLKDRLVSFDAAPGADGRTTKLILGGLMMGLAQFTDELAVMKTTSGLLVEFASGDGRFDPCIRCGRCVTVCPMGLVPSRLSKLAEAGCFEDMVRWHVIDCMECGCCAFTCPARRPIVHHVKLGKWMMQQALKKEQAKAKEEEKAKEKQAAPAKEGAA